MEFFLAEFRACSGLLLDILFVKLVGSFSNLVWRWPLDVPVVGLLWGSLVQASVIHCPCLALGNLSEATSNSLFLADYIGFGYAWKHQAVNQGWLLPAQGPAVDQQTSQGTPGSALPATACQLAVRISHWKGCLSKSLWQNREDGAIGSPMRGRCHSYFRKDGRYIPLHPSYRSECVLYIFSDLARAEPLVVWQRGPLEPRGQACYWCYTLNVPALSCSFPYGTAFSGGIPDLGGLIQSVSHLVVLAATCMMWEGTSSPSQASRTELAGELISAAPQCSLRAQHFSIWLLDRYFPRRNSPQSLALCGPLAPLHHQTKPKISPA